MSSVPQAFYFFSTEGYATGLPCTARYVRHLTATSNPQREVILVECDIRVPGFPSEYLVLVPKLREQRFDSMTDLEPVFVSVLDGTFSKDIHEIDLTLGSSLILDIGGIALDRNVALKWQIGSEEERD